MKIIDLTADMYDGAPTMPMDPKLSISWHCNLNNLGYNLSRVVTSTHQGTHMDAPRHFFDNGECIDEIELTRCVVPAFKINLRNKGAKEPIEIADMAGYEDRIKPGCGVLFDTGWDSVFPEERFFSDFPYVSKELANWLAEKKPALIGMDMPTPNGQDWKYVHTRLLGAGVLIVEGLCNMAGISAEEFTFFTLPLKLRGRDGSPVRAIAIEG